MAIPTASDGYTTLTAMIMPALFITATGSLIISTSNRMSRIVDRIRVVIDLSERLERGETGLDFPEDRRAHADCELDALRWRSERVRRALTLLYLGLSAFVGTSLTLALDVLLNRQLLAVPTLLAILGVGMLLAASGSLAREALRALRSSGQEIAFYESLRERRRDRK
jgi:hypothetical protein